MVAVAAVRLAGHADVVAVHMRHGRVVAVAVVVVRKTDRHQTECTTICRCCGCEKKCAVHVARVLSNNGGR